MTKMEVIRENLSDLLAVERNVFQRIERQTRDERVKKLYNAYDVLHRITEVLTLHIGVLELHVEAVDAGLETKIKKRRHPSQDQLPVYTTDSNPMNLSREISGMITLF